MKLNIQHKRNRGKQFKQIKDIPGTVFSSGELGRYDGIRLVSGKDLVRLMDKRQRRKYFRALGRNK